MVKTLDVICHSGLLRKAWSLPKGSGTSEVTLVDLVRNGTMNAGTAATLASIVAEQHSFMVVVMPRLAGKAR